MDAPYKQLEYILKSERHKLPDFLVSYGSYNNLREMLQQIEAGSNSTTTDIVRSLLLGLVGNESNKQHALYELPTTELISVISTVCILLNITSVEELCAGQGLLSKMLELNNTSTVIKATDGFQWIQTFGKQYLDVEKKLLLDYALDAGVASWSSKLLVVSWLPEHATDDFLKFITTKKPNNVLLIGEDYTPHYVSILQKFNNMNYYKRVKLPVKQICYRDYYTVNKVFPPNSCRSTTNLFILKLGDNSGGVDIDENTIKTVCGTDNFCSPLAEYTDKMYIQDAAVQQTVPRWFIRILDDDTAYKDAINKYVSCVARGHTIPDYIKNYPDFKFWYQLITRNRYPTQIGSHEKFQEYKDILTTLMASNDGLDKLKQTHVLPVWINNQNLAEKYIWLDFSTENKRWKESSYTFLLHYNTYSNLHVI